jgi:hypothetical protein
MRMRPLTSRVAVRCARAVDMLAVAVQLPAAAVAEAAEPSAAELRASNAQITTAATDLKLTTMPVLASTTRRQ